MTQACYFFSNEIWNNMTQACDMSGVNPGMCYTSTKAQWGYM